MRKVLVVLCIAIASLAQAQPEQYYTVNIGTAITNLTKQVQELDKVYTRQYDDCDRRLNSLEAWRNKKIADKEESSKEKKEWWGDVLKGIVLSLFSLGSGFFLARWKQPKENKIKPESFADLLERMQREKDAKEKLRDYFNSKDEPPTE